MITERIIEELPRPPAIVALVVGPIAVALAVLGAISFVARPLEAHDGFIVPPAGIRCDIASNGDLALALRVMPQDDHNTLLDAKPPPEADWSRVAVAIVTTESVEPDELLTLARSLPVHEGFDLAQITHPVDLVLLLHPANDSASLPGIRLYWTGGEPIYVQKISAESIRAACAASTG